LRVFCFSAIPALRLAPAPVLPAQHPWIFPRRLRAGGSRVRLARWRAARASRRIHQRQRSTHWPFRASLGYAPFKTHFWACRGDRASACADESLGPPTSGGRVCLL